MCHCPHIFKKILFNARKQKDDQIGTNIDRWYWYRSKAERFVFFVLDNTTKWIVESKHHSDLVVMKCLQTDDDSSHDTLLSPT